MRTRFVPGFASLTLAFLLAGCSTKTQPTAESAATIDAPTAAEPVEIVNETRGDNAAFKLPGATLLKTQDDLRKLGLDSIEGFEVDFASHDVVVVALGEQPTGGYWTDITGVQFVGGTLWVQATVNRPADSDGVTQALTYPFAAASIANTTATIVNLDPREVVGQPAP